MNNHITLQMVRARLDALHMRYEQLVLSDGYVALITQYGGRLIGPFSGDEGESLLWLNKVFLDDAQFRSFISDGGWNLGGERLWVNPELRFFCKTPETFDETYTVQKPLDPGNYQLQQIRGAVNLQQSCAVNVLESGEVKTFDIARRYAKSENPLRFVKSLQGLNVRYCGYSQDVYLKDTSPAHPLDLEPWVLSQINPGGKLIVPIMGDFEFVDYYEPVGECQRIKDGYAELDITGNNKYKVAYRSAQTFGRAAYVMQMGDGWQLMVRNYYNDPSIPYLSEPWGDLGNRGCSFYCYNDHGETDGFAEFENSCPVTGEAYGRDTSFTSQSNWFFLGSKSDIEIIIRALLGVSYAL